MQNTLGDGCSTKLVGDNGLMSASLYDYEVSDPDDYGSFLIPAQGKFFETFNCERPKSS